MSRLKNAVFAFSLALISSVTACRNEEMPQQVIFNPDSPPVQQECALDNYLEKQSVKRSSYISSFNNTGYSNRVINLSLKKIPTRNEINNMARQYNARVLFYLKSSNTLTLQLNRPVTSNSQISSMSANSFTKNAIPDQKVSLIRPVRKISLNRYNPGFNQFNSNNIRSFADNGVNDPYFKLQYGLKQLEMETVWPSSSGGSKVKVAVIDSGIDLNHPELKGKLAEGKNFIDESAPPEDDDGHGTHVAGIIGASINDNTGVASMCGNCNIEIMPVKVLDSKGEGSIAGVAAGIEWAVDNGAKVLNLSLGAKSGKFPEILGNAVKYAISKGAVVIFAAGNDNAMVSEDFPKGTIVVSATNTKTEKADFSNFGKTVTVSAPGDLILSTYASSVTSGLGCSGYMLESGTSMAAPHVSGLAAMMLTRNSSLTGTQVKKVLETTATDLGEKGWDQYFGHGMINVKGALAGINK